MKKLLLPGALLSAVIYMASCKEVVPNINPANGGGTATDTTYVGAIEAKQDRMVMIEEFTGVSCPPCPDGHRILASLEENNPGRLAVIGIQPFNVIQANPVEEEGHTLTQHDNRNQEGTDIAVAFGGLGVGIPTAMIDRQRINGSYFTSRSSWSSLVTSRLSVATPLNLDITSSVDGDQATTTVKVAFTAAVTTKQYMVVTIIEDSVIDAQKNGLAIDTNYVHKHVLRDVITSGTGDNFLGSITSIEPGRVYEKRFKYTIDAAWKPENCHVVAYIVQNESGAKEVEQAAVAHLKGE